MKILYVHHGGGGGGAPISLLFLIKEMVSSGARCDLMNTTIREDVVNLFSEDCAEVYSKRLWYYNHSSSSAWMSSVLGSLLANIKWLLLYPVGCYNLCKIVRKGGYDVVHLNSATLLPYAWLVRFLGVPVVCHIREPFHKGFLGWRRAVLRRMLRLQCNHSIAICEDNADDSGLPNERMSLVYNPVDFSKFDSGKLSKKHCRTELGIPEEAFVTIFAGGCSSKIKGVSEYVEAMASLIERIPNLVCLMPSFHEDALDDAGAKDCFSRIRKVVFNPPFVNDMEKWLAASDVAYALHNVPHFSRTVMEAGAMKRPVVATDIRGISEVVSQDQNGVLVEVGDAKGVADATIRIYEDPEWAEKLGLAGYQQAVEKFESGVQGQKVMGIYRDLVEC